eukprot:TRINITY_DN14940_c0_g1_i6.p1 TRINITY_DN14940_c0_g1~~TRINITY_DN14940_c0_g1_i6.p1  ORF type:complete len:909 (+),score=105.95 TRINITY_DN14940_c0_g1_i6:254-2728(+)
MPSAESSETQKDLHVSSNNKSKIGKGSPEKASERQPFDCDKPGSESSDPQDALLTAVALGHLKEATQALDDGADPNMLLDIRCFKKAFFNCTPLAIAILKGHNDLANLLCRSKADPNATYSFEAGRKLKLWTGPVTFATTVKGNLSLLDDLVSHRADVHKTASNGASLIWQAGYMGHVEMCRTLIEMQADIEQKAANVDDEELQHSPVHTAAITGRVDIIKLLVEHKARLDVNDGKGHHPLDDAVLEGHGQALKLLISSGANPWRELDDATAMKLLSSFTCQFSADADSSVPLQASKIKRSFSKGLDSGSPAARRIRSIDVVFKNKNPLLISAIAQGLGDAPSMLDQMSPSSFLQFLSCPGDAPLHIMDAVFRQYTISSWTRHDEGELIRVIHHSAFVRNDDGMVVMSGPHYETLKELFDNKKVPPDQIQHFLDDLLPSKPTPTKNGSCGGGNSQQKVFAKITCTMCHVPGLHEDLQVLRAIVQSPSMQLFESRGCRAIIQYMWMGERRGSVVYTALTFVEVLSLFLINLVLNSREEDLDRLWTVIDRQAVLTAVNVWAVVIWLLVLFLDLVCKTIGYHLNALLRNLVTSRMFWFQLLLMTVTFGVHLTVHTLGLAANTQPQFCISFGLVIALKWARVMVSLTRTSRAVGVSILPIITTMFDIGSFCCVLVIMLCGLTNLYYALGLYDLLDSFMLMYRLAVVLDADQSQLQGNHSQLQQGNHSQLQGNPDTPVHDMYYYAIRYAYVAVSFLMGLSLMNVFIAVLCDKYSKAEQHAEAAFVRERARMILDKHAIRQGLQYFICRRRKQEQNKEQLWIVQRDDSHL